MVWPSVPASLTETPTSLPAMMFPSPAASPPMTEKVEPSSMLTPDMPLGMKSTFASAAATPMRLPRIQVSRVSPLAIDKVMPWNVFPEITLPSPAPAPPIVVWVES